MAVDGRLNFDTKIDTKGFSKGVNSLSGQLSNLIGLAGKLAAALGAAFGVKQIIESAAEVKAAQSQFEQTFGEIQSQAESMITGVAKSSGILETRLKGVGTSIYAFAKTTGMDSASALNLMNDALQVTADSAAYYDRSLEDTAESLKSFLKGNFENDAALGLSCTETTRNAAANKLYSKSFTELSEAQKQMTLLQMVKDANALSGAMGQAAREADGWENVTGNLKEAWKQLLAAVGQPVLALAVPVVNNVTAALQKMTVIAQSAAKALSEVFGIDIGLDSTAAVSDNTSDLSSKADLAAQSYENMAAAAEEASKANKNSLASFDKINKLGDTSDSTAGTNTVTAPASSSGGLQGNISVKADVDTSEAEKKFAKLFKDIKKGLNSLFKPLKSAWNKDGKKVTNSLKYAFKEVFGLTKKIGKSFGEVWTNGTGEKTVGHILRTFQNINVTIGNIAKNLNQAWSEDNLGTDIIQNIADIFNTILRHNENISKKISEWSEDLDFSPALTALRDLSAALEPFTDTIGDGLETFFDEVLLPLGKWTIEDLIPTFLETLADVITGLQKAWETAAPVIKDKLWDGFLKPIAEWTADVAIGTLESLGDGIKKIGESMTEKDVEVLIDLSGAVVAICAAAKAYKNVQKLSSSLESLKSKGSTASTTLQSWIQPLSTPASEGGTTFATKFCAAVAAFFAGWEIGTAIRDAIGGDKIDEALFPIFDGIVSFFTVTIPEWWDSTTWQDFIPIYNIFGDQIDGWLHPILDSIVQFFTVDIPGWWDTLQEDTLFPIYDKAVSAWESVVTFFTESIPTFFTETVPSWFSDLWESIKEIFKDCVDWWSTLFSDAWNGVTGAFSDFKKFFSDKWIDITTAFSDAASWLGDKFSKAWENIKTAFSLSSVSSFFGDIWDSIKSAFSTVGTWFEEIFSKAWQKVKDVFSTGGKIFSGIKDGISEVFTDTVNTIIDGLNIVIAAPFDAINDAIGWIRDLEIAGWNPFEDLSEISVPQIPKLATGTVVPANYGQFLAVLGDNKREAEVVSPLSTMKQAVLEALVAYGGTGGNGQKTSLTIPITLNGRTISQIVIDDINEYIRRNGRSPIKA